MNVVWVWVIALLLDSYPRRDRALETEVPSSITCIIGHLTWVTWLCVSMHRQWRLTLLPYCLLALFQVIAPIRAGIIEIRKGKSESIKMHTISWGNGGSTQPWQAWENTLLDLTKNTLDRTNKQEIIIKLEEKSDRCETFFAFKKWILSLCKSVERWQSSEVFPGVHLCWARPNNHTYILALLCTRPISTGLITFSLQFRCGTLTEQYLIDMSCGLTIATKHQGSCFCWHCLSPPLKAKPLWTQQCIIEALCHTIQQINPFKCLSMIRQRGGTRGGAGQREGGVKWMEVWKVDGNGELRKTVESSTTRGQ